MFSSAEEIGPDSSTTWSKATAFGIGSSRSVNELAFRISAGAGFSIGAACAALRAPNVATAPSSPAIFFSIQNSPFCRQAQYLDALNSLQQKWFVLSRLPDCFGANWKTRSRRFRIGPNRDAKLRWLADKTNPAQTESLRRVIEPCGVQ